MITPENRNYLQLASLSTRCVTKEVPTIFFTIDTIHIDFNEDIQYSRGQTFINYPPTFPTIKFQSEAYDNSSSTVDQITYQRKDATQVFMISINNFTPKKVNSCIQFFAEMAAYSIVQDDEDPRNL